jgi:aspartate-semialdehyde dehydrogenase
MASKILIVDPLTLIGREFARCLEEAPDLVIEVDYRHTSADDEHQIAELGAQPALVPPLDGPSEIADAGIVVVTTDVETERTRHLEELMIRHPEVTLIDVSRLPGLAELTIPAVGATARAEERHLRVAHPALAATASILTALRPLEPVRGSLAAVDPVSTFGRDALEVLVHQAGRRMQGGDPDHLIDGHVLAFNQVAVGADALTEEAADLIHEVPLAVTRTLDGCFHGHVAHLSVELAEPVDDPELREAVEASADLVVGEAPMGLELVPDRDQVLLAPLQLSPDRRIVAVTAMVDGLRFGGALTAVDILRSMTVN